MNIIGTSIFSLFFLLTFLYSSGKQPLAKMDFDEPLKERITFNKNIKPIIDKSCGGVFCHHGKPSAWNNYKVTKAAVDNGNFYREVIQDKTMPKRKKLSKLEYQTIKKWLEDGAIEK